ncbi:MAG TPA: hypothetical protein VKZ53_22705 [Candidatus Angelobacter sp.]|nr:hypothetical protein [Candidatus Angelobacter sp.]
MSMVRPARRTIFVTGVTGVLFLLILPALLFAQTNCDEGAGTLNPAKPQESVDSILQKVAAKETLFQQARNNYTYTQDVSVQTLDGTVVSGEFREVTDILFDGKGKRLEDVKFAPQSSLVEVSMTKEDVDDVRHRVPFVLTTEDMPQYNLLYVGTQRVDEIDAYVFDMAPKKFEKDKRYFQGRLWIDNHDLQIVKTCGKAVPEVRAGGTGKKKKNVQENLTPTFVTYREQIDGEYWFPTYSRADEVLHFATNDVHIREVVKFLNYKRFGSKTRIILKGEATDDQKPKQ